MIEKIPYLKSLGVTAVELMPVHEFPDQRADGETKERPNYWGYDPMAFFSPHRGYMSGNKPGDQVRQFKEMVRALHAAGIEVILDVVFNHTAEGNEQGPTFSFKGLENRVYYMLDDGGTYKNYSGLRQHGQRQPPDRPRDDLPLPAALGAQLSRRRLPLRPGVDPQPRPERRAGAESRRWSRLIAEDPMLADTKIIAEAWDAAGAYQVGSFGQPALGRVERPLSRRRAALLARRPTA